jgi:3-oxoacyl-ACP reductase-like protein
VSIFGSIMNKIFHPAAAAASTEPASPSASAAASPSPSATATSAAAQSVDVEAVLVQMAAHKNGGGNWKTSIVDLLKLLDLESSLDARKELAHELNISGVDGSAEKNIALHKAVMQKLSENGGKVPDSLKG